MKKVLSVLLAVCMVVSLFACLDVVATADATVTDPIIYKIDWSATSEQKNVVFKILYDQTADCSLEFDYYLENDTVAQIFNLSGQPGSNQTYNQNDSSKNLKLGVNHYAASDTGIGCFAPAIQNNGNTKPVLYIWNVKINGTAWDGNFSGGVGDGIVVTPNATLPCSVLGNHNFVAAEVTPATCQKEGVSNFVCSKCHAVKNISYDQQEVAPADKAVKIDWSETSGQPNVWLTTLYYDATTVSSFEFDYYLENDAVTQILNISGQQGSNQSYNQNDSSKNLKQGIHHYSASDTGIGCFAPAIQNNNSKPVLYIWNVKINGAAWNEVFSGGIGTNVAVDYSAVLPAVTATIPKTAHSYQSVKIADASCTSAAQYKYVCEDCTHTKTAFDAANTEGIAEPINAYKAVWENNTQSNIWFATKYPSKPDVQSIEFDYYLPEDQKAEVFNVSGQSGDSGKLNPNDQRLQQGAHHYAFSDTGFGCFAPAIQSNNSVPTIYFWNVKINGEAFDGKFSGVDDNVTKTENAVIPEYVETVGNPAGHTFGEWVFTEETASAPAFATRTCECGATETVEAKDIVKADWAPAYADAKGGSSQYPGFYLGQVTGLEADDVVTVEFDLYHPGYDPATNILKVRSNNGESASEFILVEDGSVAAQNRTIKYADGHVIAQYTNTQARDNIYFGLQESVHKDADEIYVWNVKYFVNGEEVTANGDAFSIQKAGASDAKILLSRPQPAGFQIGTQTNGANTRLIMKLCDDQATIEAYESLAFKVVIDGKESTIALDTVYDGFMDENMGEVTAASLGCNFVAIYGIGDISAFNSVTVQAMVNGAEVGVAKTLK